MGGHETAGHVRSVAAGVHPHRAAQRAGNTDRPLETAQPGSGEAAGDHGKCQSGAAHGPSAAARPRSGARDRHRARSPRRRCPESLRRRRADSTLARRRAQAVRTRLVLPRRRRGRPIDCARTNNVAGPPRRYVVNGASATSRSARSPSTAAAASMRSTRSAVVIRLSAPIAGPSPLRAAWRCRRSPSKCRRRPRRLRRRETR